MNIKKFLIKKELMQIVFGGVAILVVYLIFFNTPEKPRQESVAQVNSDIIIMPEDTVDEDANKSKMDLYEENLRERNKSEVEISNKSFFGGELAQNKPDIENEEEVNISKPEHDDDDQLTMEESDPDISEMDKQTVKYVIKYVEKKDLNSSEKTDTKDTRETGRVRQGFSTIRTNKEGLPSSNLENISIPVVVQQNTSVKNGSELQLRTTEDVMVDGLKINANTFIMGKVTFSDEKVFIIVNAIKAGNEYLINEFSAYDLYGNEGLTVTGGIEKEIKKDLISDGINSAERLIEIPLLKDIGIKAGKKKVKDPELPLRKGHKMILKKVIR